MVARRRVAPVLLVSVLLIGGGLVPPAAVAAPAVEPAPGVKPVPVPAAGRAVDTSTPDRWVGTGTPASCTSAAFVAAVRAGGVIRFKCGANPVTIHLDETAKLVNTTSRVVIDGRGKVTLDGGGVRRILYLDTCDVAQGRTTDPSCTDQATPELIVQNIAFAHGDATGQTRNGKGGGGGAIFARGGQLRVVNATFTENRCDVSGADLGGGAIRALSQYQGRPVYVTGSTFADNACSNGAGLSSINVSWVVLNSRFSGGLATGTGANPPRTGTPGGGSGGAVYTDGKTYSVQIGGTLMQDNHANEGGGALFFVSNDRTGTLSITSSTLQRNVSGRFQTQPGIYFLGRGKPVITDSVIA